MSEHSKQPSRQNRPPVGISFVIPAYNEEKYIGDCLASILAHAGKVVDEIIVVNNASTDRTAEIADAFPKVRVVHEPRKGLSYARQRGFKEAKQDLLAYVDADTILPPHWCDSAVREFQNNPSLACLSGPYVYHDISAFQTFWSKAYLYCLEIPVYWLVGYMIHGGNFAIRKSVLEQMSGFDTTIEFYGEDTDIARRASAFGKVKFKPSHFIYTSGRRFHHQGLWTTAGVYAINYAWEVIFGRPFSKKHRDVRL